MFRALTDILGRMKKLNSAMAIKIDLLDQYIDLINQFLQ